MRQDWGMPATPALTADSRWPLWMTEHRWAGAIALGVALGLVWGATAGVVVATLIGYGVLTVLRVSLLLGILVVGVPTLLFAHRSLKTPERPGPRHSR